MTMFEVDNELFRTYAFWAGILIAKVMGMSVLTARIRIQKKVVTSPEDVVVVGKTGKVLFGDPDIERVRRAHLNDLENIIPFLIIALLYILTNPAVAFASLLFKVYGFSRLAHTFVYAIYVVPQPARAIAWFTAYAIQFYMAFQVILYFY